MALDPRRMLELLRIAEHGSYSRAAAAQGVSQPALSNSIATLERMLGVRLLERGAQGASLTEYGRLLADHATSLRSLLDRAAADIELRRRGLEGSLVIGASPVACVELVPAALARMKADTPNVTVFVHEKPDDELLSGLRSGDIDLVVSPAGLSNDPPDIERAFLLRDHFAIAMRAQHPLSGCKSVTLRQLRGFPWAMPDPNTAMYRHIELAFSAENEPWPAAIVSTNSITAIKSLIMRTDFVTISSRSVMAPEIAAGLLAAIAFRKRHFGRDIVLRRRRTRWSPLCELFGKHLRAVAGSVEAATAAHKP